MKTSNPTVAEMARHVAELIERHDIYAHFWARRLDQAFAINEPDHDIREISIAPVRSAISYGVALHEIGHILGRYQRSALTMTRERWAWRWAVENALVWTPAMERSRVASLAYAAAHGPRRRSATSSTEREPQFPYDPDGPSA
jgi:hypothetical protein